MTAAARRDPAQGLFVYGLVVICALALADMLGLPGGTSVGQLMMLAGMPFWANAVLARQGRLFDPLGRAMLAVILSSVVLLSLLALFSATYAAEPVRIGRMLMTMIAALAMFAYVAGTLTERRMAVMLAVVCGAVAAISIVSIAGYASGTVRSLVFGDGDRAFGTFKNPNQYGIVISTVAPVAAGMMLAYRGQVRNFAFLCLMLMLAGLLLSGSKTNLLLTGASLTGFAVLIAVSSFRGIERTAAMLLTLAAVVLALVAAYYLLKAVNPRAVMLLGAFFDTDRSVPTLTSRQQLWSESIAIFGANPWRGEGAGQFLQYSISGEIISHSHNLFLDYARTLGAPGLILIGLIVGAALFTFAMTVLGLLLGGPVNPGKRALLFGLAMSGANYIGANMVSESFGPTTSPFFWLSLMTFFLLRGTVMRLPATLPTGTSRQTRQFRNAGRLDAARG